jgi:hypothetical protein
VYSSGQAFDQEQSTAEESEETKPAEVQAGPSTHAPSLPLLHTTALPQVPTSPRQFAHLPPASQLAENPDGSTDAMVQNKSKIVVVPTKTKTARGPTKLKTEVVQTKPKTAVVTTKSNEEDEAGQLKEGEPGKT